MLLLLALFETAATPPSPFHICFCFFSLSILFVFLTRIITRTSLCLQCFVCDVDLVMVFLLPFAYDRFVWGNVHLCIYGIIALRWIMYVGQHPSAQQSHTLNLFCASLRAFVVDVVVVVVFVLSHQPWRISFRFYIFWFTLDRLVSALLVWIRSLECRRRHHFDWNAEYSNHFTPRRNYDRTEDGKIIDEVWIRFFSVPLLLLQHNPSVK